MSHCGTGERAWPWEPSGCCWAAARGQALPGAEAQIHRLPQNVRRDKSEGDILGQFAISRLIPLGGWAHAWGWNRSAEGCAAPHGRPTPLGLPMRDSPSRHGAAAMAGVCKERGRVSAFLPATAKIQGGWEKQVLNCSYLQLKKCLSLKMRICYWQALKTTAPSLSVKPNVKWKIFARI